MYICLDYCSINITGGPLSTLIFQQTVVVIDNLEKLEAEHKIVLNNNTSYTILVQYKFARIINNK